MSNLSIGLTFSEDGEYLQLSRMDAAILLTWIMGGDHDNEPEVTVTTPTPKEPESPASPESKAPFKPEAQAATRPALTREELPIRREATPSLLPKNPPAPRREAPPVNKKAAQIIQEPVAVPDLPFSVTPNSAEFTKGPSSIPPTENELLEEEPYWDYGNPPEPKA
jgi:hypothetical protein